MCLTSPASRSRPIAVRELSKRLLWSVYLIYAVLSTGTLALRGEDMLIKKGAMYIGWQTATNEFRTCRGPKIAIGDGVIAKTTEKCPKDPPPNPNAAEFPLKLNGTVLAVDAEKRTIQIKSDKGLTYVLFLPKQGETASHHFADMKVGDQVTVAVPINGRADFKIPKESVTD
jgi:hypothetical protein